MNDAERIWSEKSDEELIEAAAALTEFTVEGQRIVRAELKRRGLEDPVDQAASESAAGGADGEAVEPECLRCHVTLRLIDPEDPEAVARWSWLGGIHAPLAGRSGLDIYVCPRCGHVDLFADPPEEDEDQKEPGDEREAPTGADAWSPG